MIHFFKSMSKSNLCGRCVVFLACNKALLSLLLWKNDKTTMYKYNLTVNLHAQTKICRGEKCTAHFFFI